MLLLLVDGASISPPPPTVMLGTGGGGGGFNAPKWIAAGGTAFNTALLYCYAQFTPRCSQVSIANAITAAGKNSSGFFTVTKIEPEDMGPLAYSHGPGRVIDHILDDMNAPYLDALLWHQAGRAEGASNYRPPCYNQSAAGPTGPGTYAACRVQGYDTLLQVKAAGLARVIGVSNYAIRDLQQIYDALSVWPEMLEIEVHPFWHEDALIDFAISKGIYILNYAPLAKGDPALLGHPTVVSLASAHGVTPSQVLLRWGMQRTGGSVLPRSTNSSHMLENLSIPPTFSLSPAEMASLGSFPQKKLYQTACYPVC